MPDRTQIVGDSVILGNMEWTVLLTRIIRGYSFSHKGDKPRMIIIPAIGEVLRVEIRYRKENGEDNGRAGSNQP